MKHIPIKMQDWEAATERLEFHRNRPGGSEVRDDKAAQATGYLQSNSVPLGTGQDFATTDFHVEAIDLAIQVAGLPMFCGQSVDGIEMIVARRYSQFVLFCGGGDPDIVFRNWPTFFAKKIFDSSVVLSGCGIATENSVRRCEFIHCLKVRLDARGFPRTVIPTRRER